MKEEVIVIRISKNEKIKLQEELKKWNDKRRWYEKSLSQFMIDSSFEKFSRENYIEK